MSEIILDVIVPIHNIPEDYLRDCLRSIRDQTHTHYRVWVVESDLSAEDNAGLAMQILTEMDFPEAQHLIQTGQGLSDARNCAIAEGNAPYITFLDGDDQWVPHHLEQIVTTIPSSPPSTVFWWDRVVQPKIFTSLLTGAQSVMDLEFSPQEDLDLFRSEDIHYYLMTHAIYPSSLVVSRSALEAVDGYDITLPYYEDVDFMMKLTLAGGQGHFINSIGVIRRPSTATFKTAQGAEISWSEELVSRYPWPTPADRPTDVSVDYWDFLLDYVLNHRHRDYRLQIPEV